MENQNKEKNIESLKSFILENKELDPIAEMKRIKYEISDNDDYAQRILTEELKRIEDRLENMGQNPDNQDADLNWVYYWYGFNFVKHKDEATIEECPFHDFLKIIRYYAEGIRDAKLNPFLKNKLEETKKQSVSNKTVDEALFLEPLKSQESQLNNPNNSKAALKKYIDGDYYNYYKNEIEPEFFSLEERGNKYLTIQEDGQLKWTGKRETLVAIIMILVEKKYIIETFRHKNKERLKLRRAFESEYNINLKQFDKPSDRITIDLPEYKKLLAFIIPVSEIPSKLITKK